MQASASQASFLLPAAVAQLAARCDTFRSLPDHAAAIGRSLGLSHGSRDLLRALAGLARSGLLVSERQLVRGWRRAADGTGSPGALATIGVPTRNRPGGLERTVTSAIENARAAGRALALVVVDDSDRPETRARGRSLLAKLAGRHRVEIRYAGPTEKVRFARAMARAGGFPRELLEFALFDPERCGLAAGANRNALLLDQVGATFLAADDDTVCAPTAPPGQSGELAFSSIDPTETWYFADSDAAARAQDSCRGDGEGADLLGLHERLLGRDLGTCLEALDASTLDLDGALPSLLGRLEVGRGRVLVTGTGYFGDLGTEDVLCYLAPDDASRERLLRSGEGYRRLFRSRQVLQCATRPTITEPGVWRGPVMGYDARDLLPPYLPVLRGQNSLFGFAARVCLEEAYFACLPWAVPHAPARGRTLSPTVIPRRASGSALARLLMLVVDRFTPPPGAAAPRRMQALGQQLRDLGALPWPELARALEPLVWSWKSAEAQLLESQLAKAGPGAPAHWIGDVETYLAALRRSIARAEVTLPYDLRGGRTPGEARALTARLIRRFGELLTAWPDLVATARSLQRQGIRLAQPVVEVP